MTRMTVTLLLLTALASPLACRPDAPASPEPAPATTTDQAPVADKATPPAVTTEGRMPTVAPQAKAEQAGEAEARKDEEIIAQATGATRQELARYATPELNALKAIEIARALSPLPGVVKARPVMKEARFEVTFTPPQANPAAILDVIKAQIPGASLLGVELLEGGAGHEGGCGSCPMKNVCGGAH